MALTKVSYSMINGAPINVLDFGADITGNTDSSTAFQNALNSVSSAASKVLVLPAGTFYLASTVTLPSNVSIVGTGKSVTIIRCAQRTANNGSKLSQTIFSGSSVSNVSIENILFDGAVSPTYVNGDNLASQALLDFANCTNVTVKNCDVTKFFSNNPSGYVYSDTTYKLGAIYTYNCSQVKLENCEFILPSYGNLTMLLESDNIYINGLRSTFASGVSPNNYINESPINIWGVSTQNVTIENCVFANNAGSSINLGGIGNFIVQNNRFTDCSTPIDLSDENWVDKDTHPEVYNIIVSNNQIINPTGSGGAITVGDTRAAKPITTHEVVVANNQIQMSTAVTRAIRVSNCDFVTITGNTLNGGSVTSEYNSVVTINNNVLNGRNATGSNKVGVLYYCRTQTTTESYAYIKNNIISYWEDGAIEILGFQAAPYSRIAIVKNDFLWSSAPTNGQFITVTPSGGNPAYRPGILLIEGNTKNGAPYVPFEGTDTAIQADSLLFGTLTTTSGKFTRDMTTASGTQTVTGLSCKPRAIIFYSNTGNSSQMSFGFGSIVNTSADNFTQSAVYDRNATSAGTYNNTDTNSIVIDQGGGNTYTGQLTAVSSNQFTITWTKNGSPTGTLEIYYLAFA